MRIHVIVDPHDKLDYKLPSEYIIEWSIASSVVTIPGVEIRPSQVEKVVRGLLTEVMKND